MQVPKHILLDVSHLLVFYGWLKNSVGFIDGEIRTVGECINIYMSCVYHTFENEVAFL